MRSFASIRILITAIFLLSLLTTGAAQEVFRLWISATDSDESPTTYTLVFGIDSSATFCTDPELGEMEAPPVGLGLTFRWENPRAAAPDDPCFGVGRGDMRDSPGVDMRPYIDRYQLDTFKISVRTELTSYPIKIEWESNASRFCDSLILFYETEEGEVVINMIDTTRLELNNPDVTSLIIYKWGAYPLNVKAENTILPEKFNLFQNFPNPFNPTTTLQFAVKQSGFVTLQVFDVLGRKIKTLISEQMQPNIYTVTWNGENEDGQKVGSGVYYVKMTYQNPIVQNDQFNAIRKVLLMK